MEMNPLVPRGEDSAMKTNSNGDVVKGRNYMQGDEMEESYGLLKEEKTNIQIDTNAIVEPVANIQVEPPSNNSHSGQSDSQVKTKLYVEYRAGKVNYPQSDSDSQSSDSAHKTPETASKLTSNKNDTKVCFVAPTVKLEKELNSTRPRCNLRRSSSCGKCRIRHILATPLFCV